MSATPASQARSFHLDAPLAKVFPLFTPIGERSWVPGWEPTILSGCEERGTVFRTHAHGTPDTTWIVTEYRPLAGVVSYARLAQDSNIGLVDVICTEARSGGTNVNVRYTLTSLCESGQEFVNGFLSEDHYAKMIEEWRVATNAALLLQAL